MSITCDTAPRWTCNGCGVSVRWLDGHQAPLPENWSSSAEGCLCLKCRREQAAELAVAGAPSDCNRDARAKLRRASLIEFEVRRSPERSDSAIARACRSSAAAVGAARRRVQSHDAPGGG